MVKLGTNLPEHLIGNDQGALTEFLSGLEQLDINQILTDRIIQSTHTGMMMAGLQPTPVGMSKLLKSNPQLIRLKELDALKEIGQSGGNHFYIGVDKIFDKKG